MQSNCLVSLCWFILMTVDHTQVMEAEDGLPGLQHKSLQHRSVPLTSKHNLKDIRCNSWEINLIILVAPRCSRYLEFQNLYPLRIAGFLELFVLETLMALWNIISPRPLIFWLPTIGLKQNSSSLALGLSVLCAVLRIGLRLVNMQLPVWTV